MANAKNLLRGNPATQFKNGREAAENGRKGGIASGEAKRKKKSMGKTIGRKWSIVQPPKHLDNLIKGFTSAQSNLYNIGINL